MKKNCPIIILIIFCILANYGFLYSQEMIVETETVQTQSETVQIQPETDDKGYVYKIYKKPFLKAPLAIPVGPGYIIEPPDQIVVYVQGETGSLLGGSRNVPLKVRPDGKISLPLLGEVYIEGYPPEKASEKIAELLKEYIKEPDVSVEVVGFNSKKVYISGAVGSQKAVRYTGNQTVLDVVMGAGYLRYGARNYRIRLMRPDPYYPKKFVLNINKLLHKGISRENMYVQPNDVIYVESTIFRWLGEQINVLVSPVYPLIRVGSTVESIWDLSDRIEERTD